MNAAVDLPSIDVDRRFADAVKAGRPEWLWFEVAEGDWARGVASIETVLRDVITHGHSDGKLIDDPIALSIACYTSGTGPLLGSWIEQGKLATTAANAEILALHLDHNRERMARLTARAVEAVTALSSGGVRPIILKGLYTAHHYFDEPGQRTASDIDLMVGADQPVAADILARLGYESKKGSFGQRSWAVPEARTRPVTLTHVHRDDPWSIDLHSSVNRKLAGGTRIVQLDPLLPLASLDRWSVTPEGDIFPPPLLLAHLLVHVSQSFESLTLQRQYEIGLVIHKNGGRDGFPWSTFASLCDQAGLWPVIYPGLHFAQLLAGNPIPEPIMIRSRDAIAPTVRRQVEMHSSASVHKVARWSWAERYMWADGVSARARQFFDEIRTPDQKNIREVMQSWRRRIYRQTSLVLPRRRPAE